MSTNLAPALRQFYYDSNGNPLSGGLLYSYQAGTTTPQVTYTDSTGGTPNANPVVLDASGGASVWLDPALSYKFVLKDVNLVQQWSVDNVIGTLAAGSVVTATIQDGSVTRAKLAAGAVSNLGVVTKTAVFTAAVTDDIYLCDTSSGAYIATLPTAIGNSGKRLTFKKTTNDLNTLTVKGNGAETVDGSNTVLVYRQNDSIAVVSDGSNWKITDRISAGVAMRYTATAGITLTDSTNTLVKFDTLDNDSNSSYSTSTGLFTAPMGGRYRISSTVTLSTYSNGVALQTFLMIYKNGAEVSRGPRTNIAASALQSLGVFGFSVSDTILLNAGDTIAIYAYEANGGNRDLTTLGAENHLAIERIGN